MLNILRIYLITAVTLVIYSLFQRGIVDLDRIFLFWIQLTPIIVIVYILKWVYELFSASTNNGLTKKEKIRGFSKLVNTYILISILLGVVPLLILVNKFNLSPNSIDWLIDYAQEDKEFKQKYANMSPPESIQIGGMGSKINFVYVKNLDTIPDSYYFERKDLRGYRIYVQRSDSVIQFNRPVQYTEVVVENVGKWISLYKLEE